VRVKERKKESERKDGGKRGRMRVRRKKKRELITTGIQQDEIGKCISVIRQRPSFSRASPPHPHFTSNELSR
jgi:hypothetical protein